MSDSFEQSAPYPVVWRKSTLSSHSNCVEVAFIDGQVGIRDSKNRQGPILMVTGDEWEAFVGGVRAGEFDPPKADSAV